VECDGESGKQLIYLPCPLTKQGPCMYEVRSASISLRPISIGEAKFGIPGIPPTRRVPGLEPLSPSTRAQRTISNAVGRRRPRLHFRSSRNLELVAAERTGSQSKRSPWSNPVDHNTKSNSCVMTQIYGTISSTQVVPRNSHTHTTLPALLEFEGSV